MDIGENLRMRRTQLKMTQTDLSRSTGIKQPTISAIENGINKPALETLMLLSVALGCTVSDLVGQNAEEQSPGPGSVRLMAIYELLNDAGRDFLLSQAEQILQQPAFRQDASISSVV